MIVLVAVKISVISSAVITSSCATRSAMVLVARVTLRSAVNTMLISITPNRITIITGAMRANSTALTPR